MLDFKNMGQKLMSGAGPAVPIAAGAGILAGAGVFLSKCLYDVEAGQHAIKFNRVTGLGTEIYSPGTHFVIPWFEWAIIFDTQVKPRTIVSLTGSRDLQMVNISIRTLVRPDKTRLPEIYSSLGTDYDEKVLPSIVNETLKAVVAKYHASELIQEREAVSMQVRAQLKERAKDFHIVVDDVAITHLNFSPEYEKSVESKQVAQQQSEKAQYTLQKAFEEKKRIIIKAQGERDAAKMIGNAIKDNPGFVDLRRIDVARDIANMVAKSQNRLLLSSEALMLNLVGDSDKKDAHGIAHGVATA